MTRLVSRINTSQRDDDYVSNFFGLSFCRLDFVEKKFEGQRPLPRDGDWKPLYLYVKSLSHGAADQISISITDRLFDSRSSTDHVPGNCPLLHSTRIFVVVQLFIEPMSGLSFPKNTARNVTKIAINFLFSSLLMS